MGFWRGLGYFINICWIIACFVLPYAIFTIWLPIIFLYVLRKGAKNEEMRRNIQETNDNIKYMADEVRKSRQQRYEIEDKRLLKELTDKEREKWK